MAGCVGGLGLMPVHASFGLVPLAYGTMCTAWGIWAAVRARDPWLLGMGGAAMVMHFSWALGFLSFAIGSRRAPGADRKCDGGAGMVKDPRGKHVLASHRHPAEPVGGPEPLSV